MTFFEQINADIKLAMKSRNKIQLEVLRAVKSELLLYKTSGKEIEDMSTDLEIKLIQKMVKQRKEAADIYKTQERDDLYNKEMEEASYLAPYLPKQLSDEELTLEIKSIIDQLGAQGMKDMGKVMGFASKKLTGKSEGKLISNKVKSMLS